MSLTTIPLEVREMIYGFVLGDHTIHIKSDVIPTLPEPKDDEDEESEEDEWDREEEKELPAEFVAVTNDDRGPLYHRICNEELLHPKDAQLYRIRSLRAVRSLEAAANRGPRTQNAIVVKDFKHIKHRELSDPNLVYETIGSLGEEGEGENEPAAQLSLAFLRACQQVYEDASKVLYSTQPFSFDDPTTFAQFFAINCSSIAQPPTPTNGGTLTLASKRTLNRRLQIRAQTALSLRQKFLCMGALDAAPYVMPGLDSICVLFDLCHKGNEAHVDSTLWQYFRHRHGFPLIRKAEVRVASDLVVVPGQEEGEEEFRVFGWRVQLLEAIAGHHMDVFFAAGVLNSAGVAARNATFAQESCLS